MRRVTSSYRLEIHPLVHSFICWFMRLFLSLVSWLIHSFIRSEAGSGLLAALLGLVFIVAVLQLGNNKLMQLVKLYLIISVTDN